MSSLASLCRRNILVALTAGVLCGAPPGIARGGDVPCDARPRIAAGDVGWQVQVDPATGVYSLPAPGTLAAPDTARGGRARDVVIQPGTTAAGGYVIRLDGASAEQQ